VVTPVVLYGSSSWTLTLDMENALRTTQRKMLRIMQCKRRRPDEDWISFVKWLTHDCEAEMQRLRYSTWVEAARRKKWRFAAKTVRASDHRWSQRLLEWRPFFRCVPHRNVGHPMRRWEDPIVEVAGGDWTAAARDKTLWTLLEDGFVEKL
jgi:hypothetical protein